MGLDFEQQSPPINLDQLYLRGDVKAGRGRGNVADVNMGADGLFSRPVEVRIDGLDTGPLDFSLPKVGASKRAAKQRKAS